jgi:hypothetical protein
VRDRDEGIAVTGIYLGLCWLGLVAAVVLLTVGLWNSGMAASEKGFYAMSFVLSLFAAVTVQKNVRDLGGSAFDDAESAPSTQLSSQLSSQLSGEPSAEHWRQENSAL